LPGYKAGERLAQPECTDRFRGHCGWSGSHFTRYLQHHPSRARIPSSTAPI